MPGVLDWVDVQAGDFTGSGRASIAGRIKENGQWWVAVSTGTTFASALWATWHADSPSFHWVDVKVGDFNGDGKADIIGRVLESGEWWLNQSNGSRFLPTLWDRWSNAVTWVDVQVGDFNGDGRSDIIGRLKQNGQWWVSRSVGPVASPHGATSLWTTWAPDQPGLLDWVDVKVGDFTGDGKTDLIGRIRENGQWWVSVANAAGTAFLPPTLWAVISPSITWVNTMVANVG
jgi:hypothetical protein